MRKRLISFETTAIFFILLGTFFVYRDVFFKNKVVLVKGGNAGLAKGGTGDLLAGLIVGLAVKNEPFLAACAGAYILKKTADELYRKVGFVYNADDLAAKMPEILGQYIR